MFSLWSIWICKTVKWKDTHQSIRRSCKLNHVFNMFNQIWMINTNLTGSDFSFLCIIYLSFKRWEQFIPWVNCNACTFNIYQSDTSNNCLCMYFYIYQSDTSNNCLCIYHHDITEILLKVVLNSITLTSI